MAISKHSQAVKQIFAYNAEILGLDVLVKTSCHDDAAAGETANNAGDWVARGSIDGSHAVGTSAVGVKRHLLQAKSVDCSLDLPRSLLVLGEPGLERDRALEDELEGSLKGHDQLHRRGGEVCRLALVVGLVDLHWRDSQLRGLSAVCLDPLTGSHFFHDAK